MPKKNGYEKKVYIQEIFTAIKYTSKVYNINVYNKKVLSKNLFNKHVYGLYNKKVYKKDFTKKHVYDNVYHIKLDKTLSSTTCVQHTPIQKTIINKQNPHTDDENVYKKMHTKNVHTT